MVLDKKMSNVDILFWAVIDQFQVRLQRTMFETIMFAWQDDTNVPRVDDIFEIVRKSFNLVS